MIPMAMASPLTGAPGAVLLYGLIGLLVWPTRRPDRRSAADGGPIGEFGGLGVWSVLWILAAALWLQGANRSAGAFQTEVSGARGAAAHWLSSLQGSVASATGGDGLALAIALSAASVLIGVGVWTRFRTAALVAGMVLSLGYWLLGQSMGGLQTTQATDLNSGPLFVLLALTLLPRRGATADTLAGRRAPLPGSPPAPASG
jgi:hypothetical protein